MRLFNKQSGFTLIELIVIIAIVAVFAAIAVPNFLSYMPKHRLNGAARQVMGDLMAARMKAVSQNRRVKVFFYNDPVNQYKICDDANNNGTVADGEGDVQLKDIQDEYHDVTLTKSADPVFQPRGTVSPTTKITLSSTSDSSLIKYVKVAITGRVKIDDTP
ncbi:MAG: GspH/FimT family pseudopilin [Desulfobacterales bacterium]|nr:GspH/FimT family pseudopilin [Desulfobacterales bacterium]